MVKARTWLALGLMSFGTLAAVVGCGSDETTGPGGGLITAGSGGTAGSAGSGAVGRGGSSASGGSAGTGSITPGSLGSPCSSDLDCGGLTCILPDGTDFGSGGPGQGMCSQTCKSDLDCDAAEAGAGCVSFDGTTGYCFEACSTGTPTAATSKCQGRPDFVCFDLSQASDGSATFCLPQCQADAECPTGNYCNEKSGLCEKTKPTGSPAGTACDPSATTDSCLGRCFFTDANDMTKGVCADFCSAGTECHFTGTKPGGICQPTTKGGGLYDPGICEYGCNCDSDCAVAGDVCQAWLASEATLKTDLGTDGFCFPNATGSTELTCGEGGAGGQGNTPGGDSGGASGAAGAN